MPHSFNEALYAHNSSFKQTLRASLISSSEYSPPNILCTYSGVTHPKSMEHDLASSSKKLRKRSTNSILPLLHNHPKSLQDQPEIIPEAMLLDILQIKLDFLLHDNLDVEFLCILKQTMVSVVL